MTTPGSEDTTGVPELRIAEAAVPETEEELRARIAELESKLEKASKTRNKESQLRPYQVELLKLQGYLEESSKRMIVLFEGRDAAGKGGTIRRVTRFMNETH